MQSYLVFAYFIVVAFSNIHDINFELDGDATSSLKDDWDTLYLGGGGAKSFAGIKIDPAPLSTFRTGGSKDTNDIPHWSNHDSSVPDKDDITNAYAAAYVDNAQVFVLFGADRFANNGDAAAGFWFFQDDVNVVSNGMTGSFTGVHKNGDLLVISNFGNTLEIKVYKWQNGNLVELFADSDARCDSSLDQDVCAITNDIETVSPWPYIPKAGTSGLFPTTSFIEGGINLSFLFANETLPCFTSFLAVTRSSTSLTAQLKDFVLNEFKLCGLEVTLDCYNATINDDKNAIIYDYQIDVTNDGFGNLYNINVTYNGVVIETIPVLGPSVTHSVFGSFTTVEQSPDAGVVTVVGQLSEGSTETLSASADPDTCPFIPLIPAVVTSVTCTEAIIDEDAEEYVYTYDYNIENIGFGDLQVYEAATISEAGLDLLTDIVGSVLTPVPPNNVLVGSRIITSQVVVTTLQFDSTFVDFKSEQVLSSAISNVCPVVPITPDIDVTKDCDAFLAPLNDKLVVCVNVTGTVCNTGNIKLNNIVLTDDFGTADPTDDYLNNIGTVMKGDCVYYHTNYYPQTTSSDYVFSDTVAVTGDVILNLGSVTDQATATCPLCP